MLGVVTITRFTPVQWLTRKGVLFGADALPEPQPALERALLVTEIAEAVANYFHLTVEDLKSERRAREVARPRQIAMYLCKQLTPRSLPEIGRRFNRDHTTVIHAIKQIEKLKPIDGELRAAVVSILQSLEPRIHVPAYGQPVANGGRW